MQLCLPYVSVYMLALGMRDADIGLFSTVGMLGQVVCGILGGAITDKLGRRWTTALFDIIAWSVPCLVWFGASLVRPSMAFWMFLGAALINSTLLITQNSWDCLAIEDAEREQIPHIYSLMSVAGNLSALFAPIAAVLVSHYSLVTAMQILYLNAFVVMTIKVVWLYVWSRETKMGLQRMAETAGQSLWRQLRGYSNVLAMIWRSRDMRFAVAIAAVIGAASLINNTFWQVIVNKKLLVPDPVLPFFPMIRSLLAIVFLFSVIQKVTGTTKLRWPLIGGFAAYLVGQVLVANIPAPGGAAATWKTYGLLAVCLLFDSFGASMLGMLSGAVIALTIDRQERSRVLAVQQTVVMLVISPFGWIGGLLSGVNRSLPFLLTSVLVILGVVVTLTHYRTKQLS